MIERGFTLLETLAALAVFAMIAVVISAMTLGAGEGFADLKSSRDRFSQTFALGRQMRLDVSALSLTANQDVEVLVLESGYGMAEKDALWLLVREPDRPDLSLVHYWLDEDGDEALVVREVLPSLALDGNQKPLRWEVAKVSSFSLEAMDDQGSWRSDWESTREGQLPRALRLKWESDAGKR
ncbi:MAG: type II secretion system protein, partial [Mariprofundaceae bacterium]